MRLFWRIYSGVLVSVVVAICTLAYLSSQQQMAALEERIAEENQVVATLMAREIEVAQLTLKWPFAGLEALSQRRDFFFWWVVADGTIRLADNAAFIGTALPPALPHVDVTSQVPQVVIDRDRNYGIVVCPVNAPQHAMTFWLGFSLKNVRESHGRVLVLTTAVALVALVVLGLALSAVVRHFVRPLQELKSGAAVIGAGHLGHRMHIQSADEIGELVASFNQMAQDLERTTVSKDYVNAIITELVDALIVFDTEGTIITVNPGCLKTCSATPPAR